MGPHLKLAAPFMALALLATAVCYLTAPRVDPTATPAPTRSLLPEGFTLIPAFTPAYACELQNVEVHDDELCRTERIQERLLTEGQNVLFIQHDYHVSQGCWHGSNVDVRELRTCSRASGEITTLTGELISGLVASPDGQWLAYLTIDMASFGAGGAIRPHVFRIRRDGTGLQQLDGPGWPANMPGARNLQWPKPDWLTLELWDGTENGWHPYRLAADGRAAIPE
jgi:hypothetical protein